MFLFFAGFRFSHFSAIVSINANEATPHLCLSLDQCADAFSFSPEQEQLRRRREEEDRIAQQNEFLRASLRGSRKLQALQEQDLRPPIGVENDAFIADEEGERIVGKCIAFIDTFSSHADACERLESFPR